MRIRGTMTIELTDSTTGEVETVTEESMIAEAINDIFSYNPFGTFYDAGMAHNGAEWQKTMLPICPNLIGGILLFSKALTEEAANICPPTDNPLAAYAAQAAV